MARWRWAASGRVPSDGGGSGATLLWLCPTDLVVLAIRCRLGGDGRFSPAVAAVISRIVIIKRMVI